MERLIGRLKACRCVFARYEKTAISFCGMIKMAFIERYLKLLAPSVQGQTLAPSDQIASIKWMEPSQSKTLTVSVPDTCGGSQTAAD